VAIEVTGQDGRYRVAIGSEITDVDARQAAEGIWSLVIGTVSHVVDVSEREGVSVVEVDGETYRMRVEEETRYIIRTRGGKVATGGQVLKAPMPGKVVLVAVEVGQAVKPGDGLIVLEAMKMEKRVSRDGDGHGQGDSRATWAGRQSGRSPRRDRVTAAWRTPSSSRTSTSGSASSTCSLM
jgi:biotin carboxyl carrier protein